MRSTVQGFVIALASAVILITNSPVSAQDIAVTGVVRSTNDKPIFMIEVTAYRDSQELKHVFTHEDGRYEMSVPGGKPLTLRFDTHDTLNNAIDWHPSVVANVDAAKDIVLDRKLLQAGDGVDEVTFIDALNGYEFGAYWEEQIPSQGYARSVLARIGMMKIKTPVIAEFWGKLKDHFQERARRP